MSNNILMVTVATGAATECGFDTERASLHRFSTGNSSQSESEVWNIRKGIICGSRATHEDRNLKKELYEQNISNSPQISVRWSDDYCTNTIQIPNRPNN